MFLYHVRHHHLQVLAAYPSLSCRRRAGDRCAQDRSGRGPAARRASRAAGGGAVGGRACALVVPVPDHGASGVLVVAGGDRPPAAELPAGDHRQPRAVYKCFQILGSVLPQIQEQIVAVGAVGVPSSCSPCSSSPSRT